MVVPVVGQERLVTCEHSQVSSCHLSYVTRYRTVEQHKCQGREQHSRREGKGSDNFTAILL